MKYDENYYSFNSQDKDRPALNFYYRLWKRFCGEVPTLEFGCGVGYLARRLSRSARVYGVEINPYALDKLRHNAPKVIAISDLDALEDDSLGAIISLHVLEHIPDDQLEELGRKFIKKLRPKGRAIFVMPDLMGEASKMKRDAWMGLKDPTHINLKSADDWYRLFSKNWGFKVIKYGADGYYDYPYGSTITSRFFGDLLKIFKTGLQFILGNLILRPGDGEAVIFVLEKK